MHGQRRFQHARPLRRRVGVPCNQYVTLGDSRLMTDPWGDIAADEPSDPAGDTPEEVIQLLDAQQSLLIAVATGGPRISDVNNDYTSRRRKLNAALRRLSQKEPFPWRGLWGRYGYWSANLGTYAERRSYGRELGGSVRDSLELNCRCRCYR